MNVRAVVLAVGLIAGSSAANAWFIFIPGGLIQAAVDKASGAEGDHCVGTSAKIGEVITVGNTGRWTIRSLSGASNRCTNALYPIRAKADPYYEGGAEQTVCIPAGPGPGDITRIGGLGDVMVVRTMTSMDCQGDQRYPVQAVVKTNVGPPPTPAHQKEPPALGRYEVPTVQDALTAPPPEPKPTILRAREIKEPKSVADRLRELKQLRDEDLITQEVYEAKQREILSSQ